MRISRKKFLTFLKYALLLLAAGALLWLLWWYLVLHIPGLIPKEQAEQIARKEAQQMCEERSEKEDVDCSTLKLLLSSTSRPGITDSENFYFYFKFTANNNEQTKWWDFDITMLPDGEVEGRHSGISAQLIEDD
jgi:hypothetical protein